MVKLYNSQTQKLGNHVQHNKQHRPRKLLLCIFISTVILYHSQTQKLDRLVNSTTEQIGTALYLLFK